MRQIPYPLRTVRVRVIISWQKCNFSFKHLNQYSTLKIDLYTAECGFLAITDTQPMENVC